MATEDMVTDMVTDMVMDMNMVMIRMIILTATSKVMKRFRMFLQFLSKRL